MNANVPVPIRSLGEGLVAVHARVAVVGGEAVALVLLEARYDAAAQTTHEADLGHRHIVRVLVILDVNPMIHGVDAFFAAVKWLWTDRRSISAD